MVPLLKPVKQIYTTFSIILLLSIFVLINMISILTLEMRIEHEK